MNTEVSLETRYQQSVQQYEGLLADITAWTERTSKLQEDLKKLVEFFQNTYESTVIRPGFPEGLAAQLENRREGVRLSVKSASRLPSRFPSDALTIPEEFMGFQRWPLTTGMNEEPATSDVAPQTDTSGSLDEAVFETEGSDGVQENLIRHNEDLVEQMATYLEQLQKRFAQFIEKSVAPVMDGLYNGLTYSKELQQYVDKEFPTETEYVATWLEVYRTLMGALEELLVTYSVTLLIPNPTEQFDVNCHEPIAAVPDETMCDEQIKETVRYGFVYTGEMFGQTVFLIRPAQVIVVKNEGVSG